MLRGFLQYLGVLALSALACGAMACSDQPNDAPIIDSVEAPLVVSEQNGTYAIPVTVLFHDNDGEAITHLRYQLAPGVEGIVDVPAPNPTRQSTVVTIVIPASTHADGRARMLNLSVIDGRGAESLPQGSPVRLD
jgi:hypothetical protein